MIKLINNINSINLFHNYKSIVFGGFSEHTQNKKKNNPKNTRNRIQIDEWINKLLFIEHEIRKSGPLCRIEWMRRNNKNKTKNKIKKKLMVTAAFIFPFRFSLYLCRVKWKAIGIHIQHWHGRSSDRQRYTPINRLA